MLNQNLLEILACPVCKGTLETDDAILYLACPACRLRYRIKDGIPVMLADEAEQSGEQGTGHRGR